MSEHKVIRQSWTESERGWGQKPWGDTLHLSIADMKEANRLHWAEYPDSHVPDWYVRPNEDPQEVYVSRELYERLVEERKNPPEGNRLGGYGFFYEGQLKKVLV